MLSMLFFAWWMSIFLGNILKRWEELRRTKQLVRYNIAFNDYISSAADMSNNKGEIKWLRPIPADAINGNYGLTLEDQNPGY